MRVSCALMFVKAYQEDCATLEQNSLHEREVIFFFFLVSAEIEMKAQRRRFFKQIFNVSRGCCTFFNEVKRLLSPRLIFALK